MTDFTIRIDDQPVRINLGNSTELAIREAARSETARTAAETARDEAQTAAGSAGVAAETAVEPANDILEGMGYEFVTGTEALDLTGVGGSETASSVNRSYYYGEVAKDGTGGNVEYIAEGTGSQKIVLMREADDETLEEVFVDTLTGAGSAGARVETFDIGATIPGKLHAFLYVPNDAQSKVRIWTASGKSIDGVPGSRTGLTLTSRAGIAKSKLTWNTRERKGKGAVNKRLNAVALPPRDGIFFATEGNTARIRAAIAKVREGTGNATILSISDSIGRGSMPERSNNGYGDTFQRSFPGKLAALLSLPYGEGLALPVQYNALGNGAIQGTYPLYDPRFESMGDFDIALTSQANDTSMGAGPFRSAATGNNAPMRMNPGRLVSRFDLREMLGSTFGEGRYRLITDGVSGAWTTFDSYNASRGYRSTLVDVALGNHVIEIERLSGEAEIRIHGILPRDMTYSHVHIINAGFSGSTSHSWVNENSAASPFSRVKAEPADLTTIALGTNDLNSASLTIAAFLANMETLIDARLAIGDVLVLGPPPQAEDASSPASEQRQAQQGLFALCQRKGVPFGDQRGLLGPTYADAVARGLMVDEATDGLHPKETGAAVQAAKLRDFMRMVA